MRAIFDPATRPEQPAETSAKVSGAVQAASDAVAPATARHFVINGRFLATQPVGVHRVATELVRHAHAMIASDPALAARIALDLVIPADAEPRAKMLGLPYKVIGPLAGNAWEQVTLPLRAQGRTVVSLCNVGPVVTGNAVTMLHDVQVVLSPESYSPGFRRWYRFQQPAVGRRHKRILTVSEFSRREIARAGVAPMEKVTVIHNGCDHVLEDKADAEILSRLGLEARGYTLALSSLQVHKNIGLLLDAYARPEMAGEKLVLFGSTSREKFEAAGYRPGPNVIFAGRVSDGELRALYESAGIFAFPSTTEGFGLPPLEAMRLGTPAIVAPCGALPEACGDAAIYLPQDDPAAWAKTIAELQGDDTRRAELSAKALHHARTLSWDAAARRFIDTLLSL